MKKTTIRLLMAMMIFTLSGCGGKQNDSQADQSSTESEYTDSLEVLNEVVKAYSEDELFAMYGGNQENAVMDAPGEFDISKTEELEYTYGLPKEQLSNIEDGATMVHLMNANTFTGAAYRLKEGVDMNAFADSVKAGILEKQWVCGQPDTLLIIDVDGRYVITAYGAAELMEVFKNNALSVLGNAQVMIEDPIM
ncbi:MAG: hypothetical protein K2H52_05425 [Lachnospiraceae bacterium]|nr:hypothetical protein [Lachnospiraceae bacterium]